MQDNDITPIDLVCVNLYPFEQTVARPGCTLADAIENIDIGGPSMVRSSAKNHKFVTIVTGPDQYKTILKEMKANGGAVSEATRSELARKAFALTAAYDSAISAYLASQAGEKFPERITISLQRGQ